LNSSYRQADLEAKLIPLNFPQVSDIKFEPGSSLSYKAEVEIQPEIEVKDYKKLKLTRHIQPVEDKEVDQAVQFLRERNSELRPVDREVREKDFVVVDLDEHFRENGKPASQKYENQLLEIEPELMLKEFQAALIGAKIGEEKNFSVEYPAEHANKRLAGQKVGYKVKVKEVKEKTLPFLDDNFARAQGDYQTLLELRLKIRESLEKRHRDDSQKELESEAIKKIVEKNSFPVPETLINSYLEYLTEELKKRYPDVEEKEVREKNIKGAEERIRWEYIYHQLAEKENVTVTEQDIDSRVNAFASAYNLPPDKAGEYLTQTKQLEKMKESLLEEKVLEKVLSFSEIKEERKDK
jgi:trigger factor